MRIDRQAWWRLPQQLRFLLAGGYNTAFGYLVFSALYLLMGRWVHYLLIGALAHVIAVVNGFIVHRRLVFRSTDHWQTSFIRFNLAQLVALGFGMAGLYLLVEFGHLKPIPAQGVVLLFSVALSYGLHRLYTFRNRSS